MDQLLQNSVQNNNQFAQKEQINSVQFNSSPTQINQSQNSVGSGPNQMIGQAFQPLAGFQHTNQNVNQVFHQTQGIPNNQQFFQQQQGGQPNFQFHQNFNNNHQGFNPQVQMQYNNQNQQNLAFLQTQIPQQQQQVNIQDQGNQNIRNSRIIPTPNLPQPPNFLNQDQMRQNLIFNQTLQKDNDSKQEQMKRINQLEQQIKKKNEIIEELEQEKVNLINETKRTQEIIINKHNEEFEEKEQQLQNQIQKLQNDIKQHKTQIRQLEQEKLQLQSDKQELETKNQNNENAKSMLEQQLRKLKQEKFDEIKQLDTLTYDLKQRLLQSQQQIEQLQSQGNMINDQQREEVYQQKNKLEQENFELKQQQQQQQQQFNQSLQELQSQNQQLYQKNQQQQQQYLNYDLQIQKQNNTIQQCNNEIDNYKVQINILGQQIISLEQQLKDAFNQINDDKIYKEQQAALERLNNMTNRRKEEQEKAYKEQQETIKRREQEIQEQIEQDQQRRQQLNDQGKKKIQEYTQKAGVIQCCIISDLLKTSDEQKSNIIQTISQLQILFKKHGNRESKFSSICYGYPKNPKQKVVTDFKDKINDIVAVLQKQQNKKGEDQPENLKEAILEACQFKWDEKYKITIVIPTSPCHGKKYHDPKKYTTWLFFSKNYDTNPDDDIEEAIKQLIQKKIVLLVIMLNNDTKYMCNQLEKLYQKYNAPQLFFLINAVKTNKDDKSLDFKIAQMAAFLIGTNNQSTKTKTNANIRQGNNEENQQDMKQLKQELFVEQKNLEQEAVMKTSDQNEVQILQIQKNEAQKDIQLYEELILQQQDCRGSIEALIKSHQGKDLNQFEKIVKTVQFKPQVFLMNLSEEVMKKKIEKIDEIQPEDFELKQENIWDCIRTDKPFAKGMMKSVYLMKKKGVNNELYVVKVPTEQTIYRSRKEAILDCRCHLISQYLLQKFMKQISEKENGLPQLVYTNLLLLQESEDRFWVAERFFTGEFIKYNNNDGYIRDDKSKLNQLAQAFSYYTYQEGGFNYVVNDIQGIGNYLTDPAINTTKGTFDDTDAGDEGIGNYLTSLQGKKDLVATLLEKIDIYID